MRIFRQMKWGQTENLTKKQNWILMGNQRKTMKQVYFGRNKGGKADIGPPSVDTCQNCLFDLCNF